MLREHYEAATVVFDKRGDEVGVELWAFIILFKLNESKTPCKFVKLNYERKQEFATPVLTKNEFFIGGSIIENDRILLFTSETIIIYDVDCNLLNQIPIRSIARDVKHIFCYEPIVFNKDKKSFLIACYTK